jgi:NDP-4-keto-2,6-dideoxyhexose 3-C-methyltransferase
MGAVVHDAPSQPRRSHSSTSAYGSAPSHPRPVTVPVASLQVVTSLLSLGDLYVSDFLAPGEQPRCPSAPLELVMDEDTRVVHLTEQPPPDVMWGERYWYRSGTNPAMRRALRDVVVAAAADLVDLGPEDVWVDVASNDGTLLSQVRAAFKSRTPTLVGIDPIGGTFLQECLDHADLIVREPLALSSSRAVQRHYGKARVVTCVAMFYDLMDPTAFLEAIRNLLSPDGLFVVQLAYTPLMLRQVAFDNICHEHARYYTLRTLSDTLEDAGFAVVDATLNDTNGGSLRVIARHADADPAMFATRQRRDVAEARYDSLHAFEAEFGMNSAARWDQFRWQVEKLRDQVVGFVRDAVAQGQTVMGCGASTKGNTLLQYFGLDHTLITAIGERQQEKWGLRTVGTDIPIVSEADMRSARPDYLLVLPWHFLAGIRDREAKYLADGGKLIVPCPTFDVVGG